MGDTVIKVENLSKKYLLHHQQQEKYSTLRDVMTNGVKTLGRKVMSPFSPKVLKPAEADEEFYALRDVSFEVKQGDRVGIIGRNGAGKSTLLKIMSRITGPTSGKIEITGRVASLLEVGTGFHPELSGRENIFLNGAILGMSRVEIKSKFDEIVAFAEVERFLDTPVKRYSSGMYVRLAFAVAAHLEPEILIVDEVLAVGDAQFQRKCLGKMGEVSKDGRTVLFVSHNMAAISELCDKAVLLTMGQVTGYDQTNKIVPQYLANSASVSKVVLDGWRIDRQGDGPLRIHAVETMDESGNSKSVFKNGDTIVFRLTIIGDERSACTIGVSIRDTSGYLLIHLASVDQVDVLPLTGKITVISVRLNDVPLNDGDYLLSIWLGDNRNFLNDRVGDCLKFSIDNTMMGISKCAAPLRLHADWYSDKFGENILI